MKITEQDEIKLDERYLEVMLFNKKGYCCSQIMTMLMLKSQGQENPDLVKAMGGLCKGLSNFAETCGVLFGGVCLLSLTLGKGSDEEEPFRCLPLITFELVEWFREETHGRYGGMKCGDILSVSPDRRACFYLVVETYEKMLSLLKENHVELKGDGSG